MPKPKAKKEPSVNVTAEEFTLKINEHLALKDNIKKLTTQKDGVTKFLKEHIAELGETTSTGSQVFTTVFSGQTIRAENRALNSVNLVPQAEELLEDAGLNHYVTRRKVEVVEIDDAALEADIKAGKVAPELVEKLYVVKTTFAMYTDIVTPEKVGAADES